MIRWSIFALAAAVWGGLGLAPAAAQIPLGGYTPPFQPRPTFSPYLNLNRFGTSPGINYYGLVRPQQQTTQQLQNLQAQQNQLASAAALGAQVAPANEPLPLTQTGHGVAYFDWSRYFPLQGLPGTFAGTAGLPGPGTAPYGTGLPRTGVTPGTGVGVGVGVFR